MPVIPIDPDARQSVDQYDVVVETRPPGASA